MGIETEYGFASADPAGKAIPRGPVLHNFLGLAQSRLPHLHGTNRHGIFLANGSLFYVDEGLHPEYCTPECTDPRDVVRHVKAGDRILERLMEEMRTISPGKPDVLLFRTNIDYGGNRATWGCHESYLHRSHHTELADDVIPHLVSRIVFTGAGGFDPRSPGLMFSLSPRTCYLEKTISNQSTGDRGIFHIKEEALCGLGYRRLHLICGNSLQSELALWLSVATTALVVILSEAKAHPGELVRLRDPLVGLRRIAGDPTLKARVPLTRGGSVTALDIQRQYLMTAEAHLDTEYMPEWAAEVCRRWRNLLDALERDPLSQSRTLDWAIKLALFGDTLRRHGLDWRRARRWTALLNEFQVELRVPRPEKEDDDERVTGSSYSLDDSVPVRRQLELLAPLLRRENLDLDELEQFLVVRKKLCEIDMRFGQVGVMGIFRSLDEAGVLDHRVVAAHEIEHATQFPPEGSRAGLRGATIRELGSAGEGCRCGWDRIVDRGRERMLDLSDPFQTQAEWGTLAKKTILTERPSVPLEEILFLEDLGI